MPGQSHSGDVEFCNDRPAIPLTWSLFHPCCWRLPARDGFAVTKNAAGLTKLSFQWPNILHLDFLAPIKRQEAAATFTYLFASFLLVHSSPSYIQKRLKPCNGLHLKHGGSGITTILIYVTSHFHKVCKNLLSPTLLLLKYI